MASDAVVAAGARAKARAEAAELMEARPRPRRGSLSPGWTAWLRT